MGGIWFGWLGFKMINVSDCGTDQRYITKESSELMQFVKVKEAQLTPQIIPLRQLHHF
jgi:hypothetical protein